MKLSNIVHDNHHKLHRRHPDSQTKQSAAEAASRALQPLPRVMASALTARTYPFNHSLSHRSLPQSHDPSPSPDPQASCTLPSIQNLIGMTDRTSVPPIRASGKLKPQQQVENDYRMDCRSSSTGPSTRSNSKASPTSQQRPSPVFDTDRQSPSASSTSSLSTAPQYAANAINNLEPHQQRQLAQVSPMTLMLQGSPPAQSPYSNSPYSNSPYSNSPYSNSPNTMPPPPSPPQQIASRWYQMNFGWPAPQPESAQLTSPNSTPYSASPIDHTNPFLHHHYISSSSSAAIGSQPQDRYICQICNKSFSRPSSLKIHSHSHTGEKPFRCQHSGCGKAFSVRSNMKRHERGCHGGGSP